MYNLRPVFDFVLERRFIFAEDNSYDPLNDSSGSIGLDGQPIANGTSSETQRPHGANLVIFTVATSVVIVSILLAICLPKNSFNLGGRRPVPIQHNDEQRRRDSINEDEAYRYNTFQLSSTGDSTSPLAQPEAAHVHETDVDIEAQRPLPQYSETCHWSERPAVHEDESGPPIYKREP